MRKHQQTYFLMDKRQFMGAALIAATPGATAAPPSVRATGPTLLTVSGAITRSNRGAVDATRDLMMHKQKVAFAKGRTFDFAQLLALPAATIRPTLEYDAKVHVLRGPLLVDVLEAAGARSGEQAQLVLRAVDGYAARMTVAQARRQRFIVATHMDGAPMALGGPGSAVGTTRCGPGAGTGGHAARRALRRLPMVAVSHRRRLGRRVYLRRRPRPAS